MYRLLIIVTRIFGEVKDIAGAVQSTEHDGRRLYKWVFAPCKNKKNGMSVITRRTAATDIQDLEHSVGIPTETYISI